MSTPICLSLPVPADTSCFKCNTQFTQDDKKTFIYWYYHIRVSTNSWINIYAIHV